MSRLSGSPYVLDYDDLENPNRPVFVATTPAGERFDTAPLQRFAPKEEIEWLWPGTIPLGKVTLIQGAAGMGKSRLALDLAARITSGAPWPNGETSVLPPADVLVVSRQDEGTAVTARVQRAGGDTQRLYHFREFETYDPATETRDSRPISLPIDFIALEILVEQHETFLAVIIDPLTDFCSTPRQFAETLVKLNDLAERGRLALIVTLPANCRIDAQGRLRVTSRWPTDNARSAWCIVPDPDDPRRRLFVAQRTNFCLEPDGLAFRLGDKGVDWEQSSRISADDPVGQLSASEVFLQELLRAGDVPALTVYRSGAERGFNQKEMRAAGKRLGASSNRIGCGKGGHWSWSLPGPRVNGASPEEGGVVQIPAKAPVLLDWEAPPRNLLMERALLADRAAAESARQADVEQVSNLLVVEYGNEEQKNAESMEIYGESLSPAADRGLIDAGPTESKLAKTQVVVRAGAPDEGRASVKRRPTEPQLASTVSAMAFARDADPVPGDPVPVVATSPGGSQERNLTRAQRRREKKRNRKKARKERWLIGECRT